MAARYKFAFGIQRRGGQRECRHSREDILVNCDTVDECLDAVAAALEDPTSPASRAVAGLGERDHPGVWLLIDRDGQAHREVEHRVLPEQLTAESFRSPAFRKQFEGMESTQRSVSSLFPRS